MPDTILREPWPRDVKMTMVMLSAWLHQRWARDGLTAEEACSATLSRAALAEITGRTQLVHARRALRALGVHVTLSIRERNEFTEIHWPKFAEFQELPSGRRATPTQRLSPPLPDPETDPEKKRESTPFGRGASPPAGEQASLVPDRPPDPSDPFDPDRLADVLGAEGREAKRAFVREHLDHLLAAARARLAERGVEEPTRAQVRSALLERLHAFWKQRAKGPRGGGIVDDDTPSERETQWLKEAQARWLRKHGS